MAKQSRRGKGPIDLAAFVDRSFIPLHAADTSKDYQSQCRRSVRILALVLERRPVLNDLAMDTVALWDRLVPSLGIPPSAAKTCRKRLMSIWRFASDLGLAVPCPGSVKATRAPKPPQPSKPIPTPPPAPPEGSLAHFFENVYRPERLLGSKQSSIENYRIMLRLADQFHGRPVMLQDLTDAWAFEFLQHRLASNLRRDTINRNRAELFTIWRHAFEKDLVPRPPKIKKLRADRDSPDSWSEDEAKRLIAACSRLPNNQKYPVPTSVLLKSVLLVAYWTGLRRSSIFGLKRCDVDLEQRWIYLRGNNVKTRRGKQFRIGVDAVHAIRELNWTDDEYLFPRCVLRKSFTAAFKRLLELADIEPSKRVSGPLFHKMRRTVATLTATKKSISAASALLGHTSEYVTLRYIDASRLPGNDATEFLPSLTDD